MKNKIQFETDDFDGCGQMIIRNSFKEGSKDYSFGSTVAYKIGWMGKKRVRISLSDGMIIAYDTEQELVDALNKDDYGYRPMSDKEINRIMRKQGNRF